MMVTGSTTFRIGVWQREAYVGHRYPTDWTEQRSERGLNGLHELVQLNTDTDAHLHRRDSVGYRAAETIVGETDYRHNTMLFWTILLLEAHGRPRLMIFIDGRSTARSARRCSRLCAVIQ
jgi:hypothetical protein